GCATSICDSASGAFGASPTMRCGNSGARSASSSRRRERATGSSSTIKIDGTSDISASSLFLVGKLHGHAKTSVRFGGLELALDVEGQVEPLTHVRQRHVVAGPLRRGLRHRVLDLHAHAIARTRDRQDDLAGARTPFDAVV